MPAMAQWLRNMGHKAAHVKMLRPIYDAQLGMLAQPLVFDSFPYDLWEADAGRGRWIVSGQIDINGYRVALDSENWGIGTDMQNMPHFNKVHDFSFLLELKALGGDIGRHTARVMTQEWLQNFHRYHHVLWDPSLTARRLVNWLKAYPFCFEQADDDFVNALQNAFFRQYNHLEYSLKNNTDIGFYDQMDILWALSVIKAHVPHLGKEEEITGYLSKLQTLMDDIGYDDGGLTDRNPETLLYFMQQLIDLRHSLVQAEYKPPLWLGKRIENGARALNAVTHTDKGLACFQGGTVVDKILSEKILKLSGLRIRKSDISLPEFGYTSLRKIRTSLIIDHGIDTGKNMHVSPFAFELCFAGHRIITSCGSHRIDENWQDSLSGIAAHSTLSIDGKEPDKIGLQAIKTQNETMNGAALFSGTHTGYKPEFGITHTRRVYLDPHGEDCRGEDLLIRNSTVRNVTAYLRFHLHPGVKTSLIRQGSAVLMRLPTGIGWVFEAGNAYLTLEPGVYLGDDGLAVKNTSQIILQSTMTDLNHQVKWAIKMAM